MKEKPSFLYDILIKISTPERQLIDGRPCSLGTNGKLNNAKIDLNLLYKHKREGINVKCRAGWVESNEKTLKIFFLNLERRNRVINTINKINTGLSYITKNCGILAAHRNFYSNLRSSRCCNCYDV